MRDGDNRKEKLLYAVRIRNEAKKREEDSSPSIDGEASGVYAGRSIDVHFAGCPADCFNAILNVFIPFPPAVT